MRPPTSSACSDCCSGHVSGLLGTRPRRASRVTAQRRPDGNIVSVAEAASVPGVGGGRRLVTAAGLFTLAAGAGLAVLRYHNGLPPEKGAEGAFGAAALGAIVAAPGVLAVAAARSRPVLLLPAGITLLPLSFLSFALVTLPLFMPATVFLVSYTRRTRSPVPAARTVLTAAALVTGLLLTALAILLFGRHDPRAWRTPMGGGSVSDTVTYPESLTALVVTAAAVAAGWAVGKPHDESRGEHGVCDTAEAHPWDTTTLLGGPSSASFRALRPASSPRRVAQPARRRD